MGDLEVRCSCNSDMIVDLVCFIASIGVDKVRMWVK